MKKPWYKKWWVWVVLIFIIGVSANSYNDTSKGVVEKSEILTKHTQTDETKPDGSNNEKEPDVIEETENTKHISAGNDTEINDNINNSEETSIAGNEKTQNEYISALGNIYTGVKVYSRESEDCYLGTIMAIDDNYRGIKGNKAVYVTGGLLEGWYARSVAIQTWYVKSNDPALPYNKN